MFDKRLRDRLQTNVENFLPGEKVENVFPAIAGWGAPSTGISIAVLLGPFGFPLLFGFTRPRIVVVTKLEVIVLKSTTFAVLRPRKLLARFPATTRPNWRRGLVYGRLAWPDTKLYVHRQSFAAVEALEPDKN
jgi:hypothetical protein